jgi:hypothetical protein
MGKVNAIAARIRKLQRELEALGIEPIGWVMLRSPYRRRETEMTKKIRRYARQIRSQ